MDEREGYSLLERHLLACGFYWIYFMFISWCASHYTGDYFGHPVEFQYDTIFGVIYNPLAYYFWFHDFFSIEKLFFFTTCYVIIPLMLGLIVYALWKQQPYFLDAEMLERTKSELENA